MGNLRRLLSIYWPVKTPCWHPAFKRYLEHRVHFLRSGTWDLNWRPSTDTWLRPSRKYYGCFILNSEMNSERYNQGSNKHYSSEYPQTLIQSVTVAFQSSQVHDPSLFLPVSFLLRKAGSRSQIGKALVWHMKKYNSLKSHSHTRTPINGH